MGYGTWDIYDMIWYNIWYMVWDIIYGIKYDIWWYSVTLSSSQYTHYFAAY